MIQGLVGVMRALKQETANLNIAVSIVAPGITVTPLIIENRRDFNLDPQEYAEHMKQKGVPINSAETVALAVGHLINLGIKGNGQGLLVQGGKMADMEYGLAKSRKAWMTEEMLSLFRGGRNAPLFPRIKANI